MCVWGVCLEVKPGTACTVPAPPPFYGMCICEPQLLFKFSPPFFHGEVGNSYIFLQKEQSISSPQAVSALKTKIERKGAPW